MFATLPLEIQTLIWKAVDVQIHWASPNVPSIAHACQLSRRIAKVKSLEMYVCAGLRMLQDAPKMVGIRYLSEAVETIVRGIENEAARSTLTVELQDACYTYTDQEGRIRLLALGEHLERSLVTGRLVAMVGPIPSTRSANIWILGAFLSRA